MNIENLKQEETITQLPNMNYMVIGGNTLDGFIKDDKHFWYQIPTEEPHVNEHFPNVMHLGIYCPQMSKYYDDGIPMHDRLKNAVLYASDVYMFEDEWEYWKTQHQEQYNAWEDKIEEQYAL